MAESDAGASRSGFTIHDVLIALTVAAILLGVAAPPFATWRAGAAARLSAGVLRADLARARMVGVMAGETVTVVLDTVAAGWRLEGADGSVVFERRLDPGLVLVTSAYRSEIPFTARGTSNLYSTTWIGVADDPGGRWHGTRVSPTGAVEPR